jgi:hypothetical protein
MKKCIKATPVAIAVAAAFALTAPLAMADHHHHKGSNAEVNTDININKDIGVFGGMYVGGKIDPKADAEAVIQGDQTAAGNKVVNKYNKNSASVNNNALNSAQGNIGVNVSGGDNNIQSNELALAAVDANAVFGAATAQAFFDQGSYGNKTINLPANNSASVSNNVANSASGNIGMNAAAGDGNVQRNAAALSSGDNNLAIATISSSQKNAGNFTLNKGEVTKYGTQTLTTTDSDHGHANFSGSVTKTSSYSYSKSGAEGFAAGYIKGKYDPQDCDPLQVKAGGIAAGSVHGKEGQGSKNSSHAISATNSWDLANVHTTSVIVPTQISWSTNTATLSNNVLNSASGNVGVNIAAGGNNLQENILAAAVTTAGVKGDPCGSCGHNW